MGTVADADTQWATWTKRRQAVIAAQDAAWACDPLNAEFGAAGRKYHGLPPAPEGIWLPVPDQSWGGVGAPFENKLCRPSHMAWSARCGHWKCQ